MNSVRIIGGGLAGSEAAWQLASRGVAVTLYEMRPKVMTKAHKTGELAELVCSNSFRGADLSNAVGLLKEELRIFDSLIMTAAEVAKVPAGGALAVDREVFSSHVTESLRRHPLITVVEEEVREIPEASPEAPVIVATGPLTSHPLAQSIEKLVGSKSLAFFDAISPIVLAESLNLDEMFYASRYGKGEGTDYLNVPLTKEQYDTFIADVAAAEKFGGKEEVESDMVDQLRPFEGCMPIEEMIARGPETLRFGPFKPVGLPHPETGQEAHAVMQLRRDDKEGTIWSMVGMQTRMRHGEQTRIFRSLPGMAKAEFVRLGTVHRNTFIDSPTCLNTDLGFRDKPGLFFAGQVTGTEGYVESTAGGLVAAIAAWQRMRGEEPSFFPDNTAMGSLVRYVSDPERKDFQPMNISFGIMPAYTLGKKRDERGKKISKKDRRLACSRDAIASLKSFRLTLGDSNKFSAIPVAAPVISAT